MLKVTQTSECGGNTEADMINGCTLYKTRTNSHPDHCEHRKTPTEM